MATKSKGTILVADYDFGDVDIERKIVEGSGFTLAAAAMAQRPIPPAPKTATDWALRTLSVLMIAPAPVITAQPMIEVTSVAMSLGIGTTTRSDASAYSAHVAAECETTWPFHKAVYCSLSFKV